MCIVWLRTFIEQKQIGVDIFITSHAIIRRNTKIHNLRIHQNPNLIYFFVSL